jgi:hypothetical protein
MVLRTTKGVGQALAELSDSGIRSVSQNSVVERASGVQRPLSSGRVLPSRRDSGYDSCNNALDKAR